MAIRPNLYTVCTADMPVLWPKGRLELIEKDFVKLGNFAAYKDKRKVEFEALREESESLQKEMVSKHVSLRDERS